jgi:glyoxylase-like metal-dependent hydrolase (beta-lactamase superfamily II)
MRAFYLVFIFFIFFISLNLKANETLPILEITKIQQGVYLHKSYNDVKGFGLVSSNGLIVIEDKKAFIVDTPWSKKDTERLVDWITNNEYQLLGSISTHSHEDRTAGIEWLNQRKIPTYASSLTNGILKKSGKVYAEHNLVGDESSLFSGMITTFYPGPGHAIDNIVVWLPKLNLLFGGCLIRSMASKSLGYTGEAYIDEWANSVEKLKNKYSELSIVVPGHGKIGGIQLLEHTKALAQKSLLKHRK